MTVDFFSWITAFQGRDARILAYGVTVAAMPPMAPHFVTDGTIIELRRHQF
jgi:hypothetical protein